MSLLSLRPSILKLICLGILEVMTAKETLAGLFGTKPAISIMERKDEIFNRRRAMRKQCLIYCLAFLVLPVMVYPQDSQTGSITGVVRTPDGEPLAGVIVLLKGPALIIPDIEAVSNKAGVYSFSALSPGTYELSFLIKGLEKLDRKGIEVSAGGIVTLDINLTLTAPREAVVVEAKSPVLTPPRTLEVTTLDDDFFSIAPEKTMMDAAELRIEQGIVFASIFIIIKSLPLFSISGL